MISISVFPALSWILRSRPEFPTVWHLLLDNWKMFQIKKEKFLPFLCSISCVPHTVCWHCHPSNLPAQNLLPHLYLFLFLTHVHNVLSAGGPVCPVMALPRVWLLYFFKLILPDISLNVLSASSLPLLKFTWYTSWRGIFLNYNLILWESNYLTRSIDTGYLCSHVADSINWKE